MTPVVVRHTCGVEVIRTPSGLLLETVTSALAVNKPDGSKLTSREIRDGRRGHHRHKCPPVRQGALFDTEGVA